MLLVDLPTELLASLPLYIRNIEDFTELASTCRTIYNTFSATQPNTILRLAATSAPTFFHPHPYFLVMATAKQVSDWARGNPQRTKRLQHAFRGGIDGLLDLSLSVAGLTLADIRRLHLARFSIINPFSDLIDKMAGQQWYETPDFWDGGVSEAVTLQTDAERAAFQIIIYGELFHTSIDAYLDGNLDKGGYPGLEVLDVGPYAPGHSDLPSDQIALEHILDCGRWKRLWSPIALSFGPSFEVEWKQKLWFGAIQRQGIEGMLMVTAKDGSGISETFRERLNLLRKKIENLEEKDKPKTAEIGRLKTEVWESVPDFHREVYVCIRKYWPGTGTPPSFESSDEENGEGEENGVEGQDERAELSDSGEQV
ncbi:hypothetical protein L218DRAFT_1077607 [Marasmius fiardii PR-910]|nr:hypothetical protein L218DRAFT_1077607 [Marasmius fiardii PR-910]